MAKLLINKKHARQFALDCSMRERCNRFTRVSNEFYLALDARMREFIRARVKSHPSVGITLK